MDSIRGIAETALVAQTRPTGIDTQLFQRCLGERRRRQVKMDALADLAKEMDHVLADAGGTQPHRSWCRVVVLQLPIAASTYAQAAVQHHDDFGIARQNFA